MRPILVTLHRWLGLATALFLFIAGLTGALISWDHEIDEWLNPALFDNTSPGTPLSPLELANRLEAADPRLQVRFMPLHVDAGHTLTVFIDPRIDPSTGKPFDLDFNQVMLDPVSGAIQGTREWGRIALDRAHLMPFLYKLHYTMHLPDIGTLPLGTLFMGVVGTVWVIDTLIAMWISFPSLASWRRSFAFRWQAGGYRLTFDLHRSGGAWLFMLVLMVAVTSVSMNLKEQVMRPVVSLFSDLSPSPFELARPSPDGTPVTPGRTREDIAGQAQAIGQARGWQTPMGGIFHSAQFGAYCVGFYEPGRAHGDVGLGNRWLYFDSRTGELLGAEVPGTGSAGDLFLQAMFPLHSGRIIGIPGRALMSVLGVAIAALSVTGVLIWARKRRARRMRRASGTVLPAGELTSP